jgi:hypothetical protein
VATCERQERQTRSLIPDPRSTPDFGQILSPLHSAKAWQKPTGIFDAAGNWVPERHFGNKELDKKIDQFEKWR